MGLLALIYTPLHLIDQCTPAANDIVGIVHGATHLLLKESQFPQVHLAECFCAGISLNDVGIVANLSDGRLVETVKAIPFPCSLFGIGL